MDKYDMKSKLLEDLIETMMGTPSDEEEEGEGEMKVGEDLSEKPAKMMMIAMGGDDEDQEEADDEEQDKDLFKKMMMGR